MQRYICIHGHFYQPPRENPWLEAVELQDSASPYHDWNERITAECYGPNATARMLDGEGRITRIVNNYSGISFNFGPTVLAWMNSSIPEIHRAVVQADRLSQKRFSGHGSALAQAYNHMILPLANTRDKHTQVIWGIRDFEYRFGRKPEGMWLAETAADSESLAVLAEHGIKFTILSPFQASRTREIGKRGPWRDVNGGRIDPTRPYLARLPGGKTINLFFYDAPVSRAIAFEGLLQSGESFAERIMSAFSDKRNWEQLVHIATDGESYGHHHRHGEMALAYALHHIESNNLARLTNYGEYLATHPPTREVQIHEKSAWSCSHGVGRWMTNCGCNSGRAGWHQNWREPLRHALDWLRDELAPLFEKQGGELLHDPWAARNDYIQVVLDRSPENVSRYLAQHAKRTLNDEEIVTVLKLMELQRHAMLMYTSCGWFFDEVSGLETVQVIQYAARAIQLAGEIFGQDLEEGFLQRIEGAKSNIPENCDGRCIYQKFVKPAMVDREKAMAHYAIASLFKSFPQKTRIYSYTFEDEERHSLEVGKTKLTIGRTRVVSEITWEKEVLCYAILYMGEHNLVGGVCRYSNAEEFQRMRDEIRAAYESADFPETIRRIDRYCGETSYSLKSLFKDEQRAILDQILGSTREDLESRFRLIVERYEPLMKFLRAIGSPLPKGLHTAMDFILNCDIRRQLSAETIDLDRLRYLVQEAQNRGPEVLDADLSYFIKKRLEQMLQELADNPDDVQRVRTMEGVAEIVVPLPIGLNLWKVQNTYWEMMQTVLPEYRFRAGKGDEQAHAWTQHFLGLGERLNFAVNHLRNV